MAEAERAYVWVCESYQGIALPKVEKYALLRRTANGVTVAVRGGKKNVPNAQGRKFFFSGAEFLAWMRARTLRELTAAAGRPGPSR